MSETHATVAPGRWAQKLGPEKLDEVARTVERWIDSLILMQTGDTVPGVTMGKIVFHLTVDGVELEVERFPKDGTGA